MNYQNLLNCRKMFVKFRSGNGQNSQELSVNDEGSTAYLEVRRQGDELSVTYVRRPIKDQEPLLDRYTKVITWNFDTVLEYYCEGLVHGE